ncbi:MAG: prepilin-type N-terminal cleavage/methylation domain-containing protein [Dechloromonas sp.]|nr:prepilin-type N-terminal cleavage/methylation domain-containing protein [Dechloromonas sp.]
MSIKHGQRGFSLIELILFIVIVSVGVLGLLGVMNLSASRQGADPLLQKQALAIAESLLAEIQRQPFSYCDPDDANATLAQSAAECTAGLSQDTLAGPIPAAESRNGASGSPYDHVTDYARNAGLILNDVSDAGNPPRLTMTGYQATIRLAWADTRFGLASGTHAALRIDVAVSNGPANVTLTGYRLRYAPQL